MSTQAQIDANRANSQKSTGPVTPEGREASSHNRGTHFLSMDSKFCVLKSESQQAYDQLVRYMCAQFQPQDHQEMFLVERMAEYEWLRRRAVALQDDILADKTYMRTAQFALFLRYGSQHQRAFNTCRDQLVKLRAEKKKEEIGFERKTGRQQQLEWQKQRHETAQRASQVDIECKIVRALRTAANNPEALEAAREVKTRFQAA
jgi:hypothetical protein